MKFLETTLKWKDYKAYPKKIVFRAKVGSNGIIKISKTLNYFSHLDNLYVKIDNKIKKFRISTGYDRGHKIYRSYVGYLNKNKHFLVYLKNTLRFKNILIKSLNNKIDILKKYDNPKFRLYINEDGKLLLRFLIKLGSRNSNISKLLNKGQKTIPLDVYKKFINKHNFNSTNISPFIENYYTKEAKQLKLLKRTKISNPQIFRLIGLINGDGTLTEYGAYFYGNDKNLHKDFEKTSLSMDKNLDIKLVKTKNTFKTYWYSKKIATKLNKIGAIYNKKVNFTNTIKIYKNLLAYSEYLSGIYDTEGTIIKDSHIIIPTSVTINNKDIKTLDYKELEYLFLLAKNQGIYYKFKNSGSEYYTIGLNKLKKDIKGNLILSKLRTYLPGLALSNKKMLDDLNINSKLELKTINIYPKSKNITANWWVKITLIKDVIKFAAVIQPHSKQKCDKLNNFIFNYISPEDIKEIKKDIYKNGSQITWNPSN